MTKASQPGPHDPPGDRPGPNDPPPEIPDHLKPRRQLPDALYESDLYPGMLSWHPSETVERVSSGHKHLAMA